MPTFSDFSAQLSALVSAEESSKLAAPPYLMTLEYVHYAEVYIDAAGVVADSPRQLFLPQMQLTGHAIECAMKACISAKGRTPPKGLKGHNLVDLGDLVLELGFDATEQEMAFAVHVNHLYAADLGTGESYKARYPSPKMERLGGSIPPHHVLRKLVISLCRQAKLQNESQSPVASRIGA